MRSLSKDQYQSLSAQLREQTSPLHRQIEAVLRLPSVIKTRDDYREWLGRYLGFYEPLEGLVAQHSEMDALGLEMPRRSQFRSLVDDLILLDCNPETELRATSAMLPQLPSLAHALGALYVVEGATLGGLLILRDLAARLGPQICGATSFFGGRGDAAWPMWRSFRTALDCFGREHPLLCADVIIGAERTFVAMQAWFVPFCAARVVDHEPA